MTGGYGYRAWGGLRNEKVSVDVTHSALDTVTAELTRSEVESLANAHGWTIDRAAEYLARVQMITSKGFTAKNFADQQAKLAAIDREFGLSETETDEELIRKLHYQVSVGRMTWADALDQWTEHVNARKENK